MQICDLCGIFPRTLIRIRLWIWCWDKGIGKIGRIKHVLSWTLSSLLYDLSIEAFHWTTYAVNHALMPADRTFPGLWGPWDLDLDHGWPHTRILAISSMVRKHPSTWRFVSSRTTREEQVFDIWGCSQGSPAPSSRYLRHSYVYFVFETLYLDVVS